MKQNEQPCQGGGRVSISSDLVIMVYLQEG